MRLYSYVVARDFGFAPNPFDGVCTLATCKPRIRQAAAIGDWIVGLASMEDSHQPRIVYVMRVDETLSYNQYWRDLRFSMKRPSRAGSLKQALGDNIYHQDVNGDWSQCDSHHSLEDSSPNLLNIIADTQSTRVLVSERFAYWGNTAPLVPVEFLDRDGHTLVIGRNHRSNFPQQFVNAFVAWFENLDAQGYLGEPYRWSRPKAAWARIQ